MIRTPIAIPVGLADTSLGFDDTDDLRVVRDALFAYAELVEGQVGRGHAVSSKAAEALRLVALRSRNVGVRFELAVAERVKNDEAIAKVRAAALGRAAANASEPQL